MFRLSAAVVLLALLALSSPALAGQRAYKGTRSYGSYRSHSSGYVNPSHNTVHSYTTRRGTHVPSYRRTIPDRSKTNNYSSRGNVNPFNGRRGYKQTY